MKDKEVFVLIASILVIVGVLSMGGHTYIAASILIIPFLGYLTYVLLTSNIP